TFRVALLLGASLGLLSMTKVSGLLIAVPVVVWTAYEIVRVTRFRFWKPALVITGVFAVLNAGYVGRNIATFHGPFGPVGGVGGASEAHGPRAIASGVLRNLGLHLGTPSDRLNHAMTVAIERAHAAMGIAPDDPRTTTPPAASPRFSVGWRPNDEDTAGS